MKNIKKILKEEINKLIISESITDIVYHFTTLNVISNLAESDIFYLPTWLKSDGDRFNEKRKFYLSVTRQRNKNLGYSKNFNVRIELDGEKLNQRYKGSAVNFWGNMGKSGYFSGNHFDSEDGVIDYTQTYTENEDRIYSYSPKISNFSKYIKRIDILANREEEFSYIHEVLSSNYGSLINVYDNENDFNHQTKNTVNEKFLENEFEDGTTHKVKNGEYLLTEIINFILTAQGLRFENISEFKLSKIIANLLSEYDLDDYIEYAINNCTKTFYNYDMRSTHLNTTLLYMHKNSNKLDVYEKCCNMLIDFLNENHYKDINDAKRKFIINYKKRKNIFSDSNDYDLEKEISFLVVKIGGKGSKYIIPEPNKQCFWDLFPNAKQYILSNNFFENIRSNKSKNMASFKKYIQHLTHINVSISDMLNIIKNLDCDDIIKEKLVEGSRFKTRILRFNDLVNYSFFNENNKITVKKMFLNEIYK